MHDFFVPPLRYAVSLHEAEQAERNIRSGHYGRQDAETILGWNHAAAYDFIAQSYEQNCRAGVMDSGYLATLHQDNYKAYEGMCGPLSILDGQAMKFLSVPTYTANIMAVTNGCIGHAFNVAHFSSGNFQKKYLVDHSLVQFFMHDHTRKCIMGNHKSYDAIAQCFMAREGSRVLAAQIIKQGWAELTEDNARDYYLPFAEASRMITGYGDCDFPMYEFLMSSNVGPQGSRRNPDKDGLPLPSQFRR